MSESIKEVTSAIKDIFINPVKEAVIFRAKNNFFGSLIISWIAWNWEKIAFLFMSNMYIADRIEFIKNHFPSPNEQHWWVFPYSNSVIWPVIIATLFTLAYPFFMYILSVIHKSILTRIDNFNLTNEKESLIRKKTVIQESENLESYKLELRAEANRKIEEDNERAARAKKNTQELNATFYELTESVNKLIQDKSNLETSLEHQANRMQQARDELTKLHEKLGPETEREIVIDSLSKRIVDQESTIKDLEIKNEAAANEIIILKGSLTKNINEYKNIRIMQEESDLHLNKIKNNIRRLFGLLEQAKIDIPMHLNFEYSTVKKELVSFANNLSQDSQDLNAQNNHSE